MNQAAVPAIGQITQIAATEVMQGDCIPDQSGFLHRVTHTQRNGNRVEIYLADMSIKSLNVSSQVYRVRLFGW